MPDSQRPSITKSGLRKVGAPLGNVPHNKSPSHRPDLVGCQFGSVKVCSPTVEWRKKRMYVQTECTNCGAHKSILYTNLTGGRTKGCRACNQPVRFPRWFYARIVDQEQRCNNPNNGSYHKYGGRGIRFNFPSITEAALWIRDNLGVTSEHRKLQLDRIDNDGHYEPGNIRWSTPSQNYSHTRKKRVAVAMNKFRRDYPHIRYADATLQKFFSRDMTPEEIVNRWYIPSCKPKGKYGTFSTADPFLVSLHKDS